MDVNEIFTKRLNLFNNLDEFDEKSSIQEKNKMKVSLRKKKINEQLIQIRKEKLKRMEIYCKIQNSINYDELNKVIPKEIINEFNNCNNKYEFYKKYLSLSDEQDPNLYIRMFIFYQIHNFVNNDITNSSYPSPELLELILKYLVYDYKNDNINQKIQIQSEIIQMLIIWNSYTDEDNTNTPFYEDQFIFFLFDLLNNSIYSVEFKINILILLNTMIKGINTFSKIIQRYEIINIIENILKEIKIEEQFIYVLTLINNIFEYFGSDSIEIEVPNSNNSNNIIIFQNSYDKFILLLKNKYEQYQSIYEDIKNKKISLLLDKSARICYKIIIKILQIFNNSMFLEENQSNYYINILISNNIALPLFYKILEIYAKEFFISSNNNNIDNNTIKITDNIYIEEKSSLTKNNTKNNLYKKCKVLLYITNILSQIITTISEKENELKQKGNNSEMVLEFLKQFNFINYYNNLLKNMICSNIQPDKNIIHRIEELIYNFCIVNKNNYNILYQNYDLVRELLGINIKYYDKENFSLLIKFIINSLLLYNSEITGSLIFNVKIIGTFCKYLENEFNNYVENGENIGYILYILNIVLNSETYRKCKINRNLIIYEFNKNNASQILEQYGTIIDDENRYMIVNDILSNLDETDILDNNQKEEIFNSGESL